MSLEWFSEHTGVYQYHMFQIVYLSLCITFVMRTQIDYIYRLLLSRKLFLCIFSTLGKEVTCFGTFQEICVTGDYDLLAWVTESFTMSS